MGSIGYVFILSCMKSFMVYVMVFLVFNRYGNIYLFILGKCIKFKEIFICFYFFVILFVFLFIIVDDIKNCK